MPYLFRGNPNMRRRSKRGLGQEWIDNSGYSYLKLRLIDKNGNKIVGRKFYLDILPVEGSASPEVHSSAITNEDGEISFPIYNTGKTEQRRVSITPLFGSPFATENQAIVWQRTMTIGKNPEVVTVKLEPGGGFTAPNVSVPAPAPAPAPVPARPSVQHPPANASSEDFPWALVLTGGAALVAGIYILPMLFGDKDAR